LKKHADRIGKELLRYNRPATDTSPAVSGKGAWDALCALLVDMGDPFSIPELSLLIRSEHNDYLELMSRYAHRNTDPVKDIFIEASSSRVSTPPDHQLYPKSCNFPGPAMSKIDVDALDIDLLMFHIFKVRTLDNRPEFCSPQ
jgi:neurofibromin 1